MVKRNKKEIITVCPECGCKSWIATTKGQMCKQCGFTQGAAPFYALEDKEE
jgi:ribosomal protein L37E